METVIEEPHVLQVDSMSRSPKAIAELQQANLQDPRNLYRLSEAYQGKGDNTTARELCVKAAEFNSLPQLNYAFIRMKAQKMAAGKKT